MRPRQSVGAPTFVRVLPFPARAIINCGTSLESTVQAFMRRLADAVQGVETSGSQRLTLAADLPPELPEILERNPLSELNFASGLLLPARFPSLRRLKILIIDVGGKRKTLVERFKAEKNPI
jgi:hypothetical protein